MDRRGSPGKWQERPRSRLVLAQRREDELTAAISGSSFWNALLLAITGNGRRRGNSARRV